MKEIKKVKNVRKHILTAILSVLVISGSLITVKSLANANDFAQGEGKLINQDGSRSEFSFNVKRNPNGKATGQATLRNPSFKTGNGQNDKIKIDVTCLKVVGNVAFIGGTTKRKNNQAEEEAAYFAVEDNGNADKIFRGFFYDDDETTKGDAQLCETFEVGDLPVEPIAEGDIQVNK